MQLIISRDFDPDVAKELDERCAIIFHNIIYWIAYNCAQNNQDHFHEGKWWTYSSIKGFEKLFPYLTFDKIRTSIDKLKASGYLVAGNFNRKAYDKTTWYTFGEKYADKFKSLWEMSQMDMGDVPNQSGEIPKPIPDYRPDSKPIIEKNLENNSLDELKASKDRAAQRKGRRLGGYTPPKYDPKPDYKKKGGTHAEDVI